jgi:hypothetical protein
MAKLLPKDKFKKLRDVGKRPPSSGLGPEKSDAWIEPWWPLLETFKWDYKALAVALETHPQNVYRWATGNGLPSVEPYKAIVALAKKKKVVAP